MMGLSDNAKIGILLIALGFLFLSLGVLLFFDAGLMAIGACRRTTAGRAARTGTSARDGTGAAIRSHRRHSRSCT
jgi:hypothetical protein